ncbi:MAG: DnaJ domain [Chloroflexota bacterium]|nr:DnaJ domain [Chloroflexota bacterium]
MGRMEEHVRGILGRLSSRPRSLSEADQKRLIVAAAAMHREGRRTSEVEQALQEMGANHEDARTLCLEARLQFDSQVVKDVPLPASATAAINYYFALGVTPRASSDRIRRAYRMRAHEVHPDRHHQELNRELWGQLMTIASDAHKVLTDDQARRAYDVYWLRRSRRVTAESCTPRERRGDWGTRYHWYMAEVAEIEDNIDTILDDLKEHLESGQALDEGLMAMVTAADLYEERILQVRTDALSVPGEHRRLAERARLELVRKDRLVTRLQGLSDRLPQGPYSMTDRAGGIRELESIAGTRTTVRDGHRRFEVDALRDAAAV